MGGIPGIDKADDRYTIVFPPLPTGGTKRGKRNDGIREDVLQWAWRASSWRASEPGVGGVGVGGGGDGCDIRGGAVMANYTATRMIAAVGETVMVRMEGFGVPMVVKDVKTAYGAARLLVSPIGGQGDAWISVDRVLFVVRPAAENPWTADRFGNAAAIE